MKYLIEFVIGDYAGDGHDRKETFIISSNRSCDQLQKAYFESCIKYDFNFIEKICSDYSKISKENIEFLEKIGINLNIKTYEDLRVINNYYYLDILMQFIELSDKEMKWEEKNLNCFNNNSKIGSCGYGLYILR